MSKRVRDTFEDSTGDYFAFFKKKSYLLNDYCVCVYVCMYVCMYVCVCVYIYIYIYIYLFNSMDGYL